ncbi:MAG: precorrin-4 C(11)-methyltransferase [Oliverpabstia sp.]|nr:precorrin-4 C(11)-methyltransferase [Lachnospiraceae bacterium]MDY5025470.1 precorrin-4 C(11)-methyltransferase [Oliverpabstia sp.]
MVHFVGAGSGAPDLITLRGKKFLEEADVIIYAGSLVNPQLLDYAKAGCRIYNSAKMTLEEVLDVMFEAEEQGLTTVRLHTGDPSLYGAIREQMDVLEEKRILFDYCPGVSSFCGAASALNLEYTLPDVSQSVIITRMAGRTPVPEKESIESFAAHHATMVVFLSTGMLEELSRRLIAGGYSEDTPAAIVYKATWEDEKTFICTVGTLAKTARENQITKTALMIIGDVVKHSHYNRSELYNPAFTTEFRKASISEKE